MNQRPTRIVVFVVAFVFVLVLAGMSLLSQEASAQSGQPDGAAPFGTLPPALQVQITFIHAAPVFSDTLMTAIDVCDEQGQIVDDLAGIVYGESRTFMADAGVFNWKITPGKFRVHRHTRFQDPTLQDRLWRQWHRGGRRRRDQPAAKCTR